jgi:Flp pilus assembly protein TadD
MLVVLRTALDHMRGGDDARARAVARAGLVRWGDAPVLHALLGMLACRANDLEEGIAHLRIALAGQPADMASRANLAQALIDGGRLDEACDVATAEAAAADPTMRLWRLRAFTALETGQATVAIEAYRRLIAQAPDDWESWNNLGNALAATGDRAQAVAAFAEAVRLRPNDFNIRRGHAFAVAEAGDEPRAVELLQACLHDSPHDAEVMVELGVLLGRLHRDEEAVAALEAAILLKPDEARAYVRLGEQRFGLLQPDRAEAAFRAALSIAPDDGDAHVQLALLYEHLNRGVDLRAVADSAREKVSDPVACRFVEALDHRRSGRFAEALAALADVPEDYEPGRRAQIVGQCEDRLGHVDAAFAAFTAMNLFYGKDPTKPATRANGYRTRVRNGLAQVMPERFARWPAFVPPLTDPPAPAFLLGFPRSGTTLLDTMLMGHPNVTVMEELPVLRVVEDAIGHGADLAALDEAAIRRARARYFQAAGDRGGWSGTTVLVDKMPLHLAKAALIHRLFPDARFLLALRHPCDVVLSCFITAFRLNDAMANFLDLRTAAETYDLVFRYWERCREVLPLDVVTMRYEDVVENTAAALRPAFAHLGLEWRQEALDHRATAAARGHIATASYAQVTEPVYARAAGRWRRYERQLRPVLPILAPWVERFGYSL